MGSEAVYYGSIAFDPDFRHAVRDDGLTVRFTKTERMVLQELTRKSGSVLSRDRLLDVISGPGSDTSDRNIDFVINRLRRKLGDPARSPDYIATRYGEGYSWIAPKARSRPAAAGSHIVVGPLRGLNHIGSFREVAIAFAESLRNSLDHMTAKTSRVALDPDCPPAEAFRADKPRFAIDLKFLTSDTGLDCVMALKVFATDRIIRVVRRPVAHGAGRSDLVEGMAEALADEFATAIWDVAVYPDRELPSPVQAPLSVTVGAAALLFADKIEEWQVNDRRLREAIRNNPDDHAAKLMLATNIHNKYILAGPHILAESDPRRPDEDEIESLVTASLPHLQDNPIYALAAAKLLFFLDRGYRRLAVEMAETAFRSSTAVAASCVVVGQIRMFLGEIDQALRCFEQAQELSAGNPDFYAYVAVLKCQAYTAMGERERLDRALADLHARDPKTKTSLALFFASLEPGRTAPEAREAVAQVSEAEARGVLLFVYYVCARLFSVPEHRENILRPALTLLAERFGYGFVPEEIKQCVPRLVPCQPRVAEE